MGNNIPIVMKMTPPVHTRPTIVRSSIFGIATVSKESLWFKLFWIMFGTGFINHAGCSCISRTTWTMDYMPNDRLIEEWVGNRIGDLSRDYIIDILWISYLVLLLKEDE